jgi:uncharacterized lipoprotein YmbA
MRRYTVMAAPPRAPGATNPFMGRSPRPLRAILVPLIGLILLAGCAGGKVSRYYVLTPIAVGGSTAYPDGIAIAVGPVVIPQYLDRPEVVTRVGLNRLKTDDLDQWGGKLDDEVTRVLGENLSDLLATDRVSLYPWTGPTPVGLQITVDIVRFERDAGGAVTLGAFWSLIDASSSRMRAMGHSTVVRKIDRAAKAADTYEATVDLMSDALAGLSQEIADAVEALPR